MPAVRIAAIVGGLAGAVTTTWLGGDLLTMLAASFAGGYVGQVLGFSLRRTLGEDFVATVLRVLLRIVCGATGIFAISYAAYGGMRIASNGRLWAIGGVGFFGTAGIGMLVWAVAPNLMLGYRNSTLSNILGCICALLTLTIVVSAIIHPSLIWLGALIFSLASTAPFFLRPARFPMSPAEALWGRNGIFGLILGADGRRTPDPSSVSAKNSD